MSKLEELIARLCPDGVEYKAIGEMVDYEQPSKYIVNSTKYDDSCSIPVLTAGQTFILGYTNETEGIYEASKEHPVIIFDDFTAAFKWVDFRFKVKSSAMKILTVKSDLTTIRYVFHVMGFLNIQSDEHKRLWISNYSQIKIPVPPLEVQREIVHILDSYTASNNELKEQLEKELAARQKQYEFYRDMLLTFDDVRSGGTSVEWHAIGDICLVFTGGDPPSDCIKGNCPDSKHPYPVWGNGREVYGYSGSYRIDKDAVVISSIGANTGAVYFREAFFTPIIRLKVVLPKDNKLDSRYLYHFLSSMKIESKSSSVPNMNASEIKKIRIPVPDLNIQIRMVHVLDTFYRITTDLASGLPAEIEARKKQYEYYRDKLLTFKELKKEA